VRHIHLIWIIPTATHRKAKHTSEVRTVIAARWICVLSIRCGGPGLWRGASATRARPLSLLARHGNGWLDAGTMPVLFRS